MRPILFCALVPLSIMAALQAQPDSKSTTDPAHAAILRNIEQVKRADYEGDRAALKRLHEELTLPTGNKHLASRVLYWRGFALWRRAINGFNDAVPPAELEADLNIAHLRLQRIPRSGSGLCRIEDRRRLLLWQPRLPE